MHRGTEYGCCALSLTVSLETEIREDAMQKLELFLIVLGFVGVGVFSFVGSYILFVVSDAVITLRVRPEQEAVGLDISQHDESMA